MEFSEVQKGGSIEDFGEEEPYELGIIYTAIPQGTELI